ncbi:hypothetical protein [Mannheimia indoligenes]|uniref:Transferrin-binding protein B C-lobe/N-lobe beta barrel domain-containing protein n=1 Tax=Mannheimia indoligenes TaxID=3103145 RepID=A0ABU7ZBL3_9PAST
MKPALKTTALAILVSLGVAACGSSGKNESASASKPVNTQVDKAKEAAEKARLEAEKKAKDAAEKARLEAQKKAQEAEKARLEAERKAKEAAEKARLEAEKKAKDAAEKARLEAQKKAQEAEKARLEAEKKAKEAADAKAKAAAEKARLEAEKKAKEAEKARLEAEKKAKEAAALKAKQEAEKVANEWRGKNSNANIVEPTRVEGYAASSYNTDSGRDSGGYYVADYNGTKETTPINNSSNTGYKLDFYKLAIEDKANPQVLGWHKGEIRSAGINGSEISKLNAENEIVERTYPEKVNYIFKNTPYATYGAVYNNYESHLFAVYEQPVSVGSYSNRHQIGEYEVIDGNKTTKIKYNDSVKGAATYKGEVLAHVARHFKDKQTGNDLYIFDKTPAIDGTVTINANFGPRAEENYTSATLDSKALGKVEFTKNRMQTIKPIFGNPAIKVFNSVSINKRDILLNGYVAGKQADEIVGGISYTNDSSSAKSGDVFYYKAVFAAEKQPK